MIFDGRQPLMEEDFQRKMTFWGRGPMVEDSIWWEAGRPISVEDNPRYKTTFDGRRLLMED